MTDQSTSLGWDVRVAPSEPLLASDLAPGEKARYWSPISATLISGERDAVLVDALLTVGQADDLVEWIAAHDRNLARPLPTSHARSRGSPWFGLGAVLDIRFPHRIAETTATAQDLYDQVLALYPDRINPDALRLSAQAVKATRSVQRP